MKITNKQVNKKFAKKDLLGISGINKSLKTSIDNIESIVLVDEYNATKNLVTTSDNYNAIITFEIVLKEQMNISKLKDIYKIFEKQKVYLIISFVFESNTYIITSDISFDKWINIEQYSEKFNLEKLDIVSLDDAIGYLYNELSLIKNSEINMQENLSGTQLERLSKINDELLELKSRINKEHSSDVKTKLRKQLFLLNKEKGELSGENNKH